MGLLTKLTEEGGSLLTEFNGKTPPKYTDNLPQ